MVKLSRKCAGNQSECAEGYCSLSTFISSLRTENDIAYTKTTHYGITLRVTGQRTTTPTFAVWSTCHYSAPVILHSRCVEDIGGQDDAMDIDMDMAGIAMQSGLKATANTTIC